MAKRRILTSLNHIGLILIGCHFAIVIGQSDCGQLEQCVKDSRSNIIWCSLFHNASTSDKDIRKMITIVENISSASINDEDVEMHWNTQEISLKIPGDHQSAQGLDIRVNQQGLISPVHVHVGFYNVNLTGYIIQFGDTKQIILTCSVTGMHNSSNVVEIRFNDDKSYSCRKNRWPSEPEGSIDKPHAHLLGDNTCLLSIPNATKSDFVDYHCRVELQLFKRHCYFLSKTITLHVETPTSGVNVIVTSENNFTLAISIAVPVVIAAVVIIVSILVTVSVVMSKAMKHNDQAPLRDPLNDEHDIELKEVNQVGEYVPPPHRPAPEEINGTNRPYEDQDNAPRPSDGGENNLNNQGDNDENDVDINRLVPPTDENDQRNNNEENRGMPDIDHSGSSGNSVTGVEGNEPIVYNPPASTATCSI